MEKRENLLLILPKEGFDTGIMRPTLDYQSFSSDFHDLYIEAYIRFVSTSLVFKGGVLPEQISGSCYWKTRNSLLHST